MLFMPGNVAKPIRVQGAFVESSEVKNLTNFLKGKGTPTYDEAVTEKQSSGGLSGDSGDEGDDPLYAEAKAEVVRSRKASASFLQRRLKVGYARAARLLDMLEENGVIGPGEGAKPRDVLVEAEDLE
jgi:S-DNA-T family DNA segregation ATPase FtsK/SpoIIIE